jgi:DNA helicase-2/ATP-dependent DNA helicase PcrA
MGETIQRILAPLNKRQHEAVVRDSGPVLVVAGAGTGKTMTLTHRAAYIIAAHKVLPRNILAVTFTNRAAREMRERIARFLRSHHHPDPPFIATFHGLALYMLRRDIERLGMRPDFTLYGRDEQDTLLRDILAADRDSDKPAPQRLAELISLAKGMLLSPRTAALKRDDPELVENAVRYALYQKKMLAHNALDFDDLLMLAVKLLRTSPEAAQQWRGRFPYLLVDEYQDINAAQYALLRELAEPLRNVFAIGDADQAIYAFRGANVHNFLDFERDFPSAKIITLEENYRSGPVILEAAMKVVEQNRDRMERALFTERRDRAPITMCQAPDERYEAEWVVSQIEDMLGGTSLFQHDSGRTDSADDERRTHAGGFGDFAVLYRLNAMSGPLRAAFAKWGIPCRVVGVKSFAARRECRDALAYMKVLINMRDDVSARRILNVPARGIGDTAAAALAAFAEQQGLTLLEAAARANEIADIKAAQSRAFKAFANLILALKKDIRDKPATAALQHVLDVTALEDYYSADGGRSEPIMELLNFAVQFDNEKTPGESRARFLEQVSLMSDADTYDPRADAVSLMSMHASKGLEFSTVFVIGAEAHLAPYVRQGEDPGDMEEERRLFHVAMTRARDRLCLCHAQSRFLYGARTDCAPSPFLADIPANLIEYASVERRPKKKKPEPPPQMELF